MLYKFKDTTSVPAKGDSLNYCKMAECLYIILFSTAVIFPTLFYEERKPE